MSVDARDLEQWEMLLARCRRKPFYTIPPTLIRQEPHLLVLRSKLLYRCLFAALFLALAGLFITIPFLMVFRPPRPEVMPPDIFPWNSILRPIVPYVAPFVGLASLCAAVYMLLRRERMVVDALDRVVEFRWGVAPFSQSLKLPLGEFKLLLYERGGEELASAALGIAFQDEGNRLRLASAKWRTQLLPIFDRLKSAFGERAIDQARSRGPTLPSGEAVCRTAIRTTVDRGASRKLEIQHDRAVLRGSLRDPLLIMGFAVIIAALAFGLDTAIAFAPMPLWSRITVGGVTAFIGAIGLFIWPRNVIIKKNDWLRLPQCPIEGRCEGALHACDVAAIQLCSVRGEGGQIPVVVVPGSIPLPNFTAYQVNLVAKPPVECRVNLICDTKRQRAESAAAQLAELLDVPVLDHR